MPTKRPAPDQSTLPFSCQSCYVRKLKCSRGNPCLHCIRLKVDCIQTSNKRRKQRFPEAELLARIRRYERALVSYGADLSALRAADDNRDYNQEPIASQSVASQPPNSEPPTSTTSRSQHTEPARLHTASSYKDGEMSNLLHILEDEETTNSNDRVEQVFFRRFFPQDGSSLFSASDDDTSDKYLPLHPAPFDIFKLWQTYCDSIHPICKILRAPTFQRKISSHGSQLHLAPASDQALFFGMYLAALLSLSPEECESSFGRSKDTLQRDYQHSAQFWLRRAAFWRTSELAVLQAFVLYLFTQQHVMDPRALSSFTGMADRLARRMGLHHSKSFSGNGDLIEQETRKRVWWELLHIDARTLERAGMANLDSKGAWSTDLPDSRSDGDLETQITLPDPNLLPPASDMIFALARCQTARCQADLSILFLSMQHQSKDASILLGRKLDLIQSTQTEVDARFLRFCNEALPQHRLAVLFTRISFSRMRFFVYLVEETSQVQQQISSIRQHLLQECITNLEDFTALRNDPTMHRFTWFLYQYMPAFIYIHLLRLLTKVVTGQLVDKAWRVLEAFGSQGSALPVDKLLMRAWKARQAESDGMGVDIGMPRFVKEIFTASDEKKKRAEVDRSDANTNVDTPSSDADYMAMLADVLAGNADFDFDWSNWLGQAASC